MNAPISLSPPRPGDYHEYYQQYVGLVEPDDFFARFESQPAEIRDALADLPPGEDNRLHEPYTWTLKQVLGHIIDCERIFSTRLLRIAVGDETPIPGIDQNMYVANLEYKPVPLDDLIREFETLREANCLLVARLTPDSLDRIGTASDNPISARAILYILVGHVSYHLKIVKQRLQQATSEKTGG